MEAARIPGSDERPHAPGLDRARAQATSTSVESEDGLPMSYREENGQVVLTMSREDYERLLFDLTAMLEFMNRLNQGNPQYTPYQVEKS